MSKKFLYTVLFIFFALSCGKEKAPTDKFAEPTSPASSRDSRREEVPLEKDIAGIETSKLEQKKDSEPTLERIFFPTVGIQERFLEYSIILSYECKDLNETRKEMLNLIPKYGFLESSNAKSSNSTYMTTRILVRTKQLFELLQELDKLGKLTHETISSIDHTDSLVWQNRKSAREKKRIARKNIASRQITSESKNWQAIDKSLTLSEDAEDQSEHEIWRVQDKIAWTKITLNLNLPEPPQGVQFPNYRNAIIGLINLLLKLSYYLIWIFPIIVILGAIGYYGKKIFTK